MDQCRGWAERREIEVGLCVQMQMLPSGWRGEGLARWWGTEQGLRKMVFTLIEEACHCLGSFNEGYMAPEVRLLSSHCLISSKIMRNGGLFRSFGYCEVSGSTATLSCLSLRVPLYVTACVSWTNDRSLLLLVSCSLRREDDSFVVGLTSSQAV